MSALIATIIMCVFGYCLSSCELIPAAIPDDWPVSEPIEDTCINPVEITEPAFVTGVHTIGVPLQTDMQIIIGPNHVWIYPENQNQIAHLVDSLWELYRPEYDYHTIVRADDFRKMVTFIDGTSDGPQFYLKAQVRYNGVKSFWAFNSQAFQFLGTLTVEEYAEAVSKYPSVNNFSFRGCGFDTLDYVKLSLKILGECKEGRWFADFKKIPIPDSIPPKFVAAGWERVLTD